jgi:hypothetical protein
MPTNVQARAMAGLLVLAAGFGAVGQASSGSPVERGPMAQVQRQVVAFFGKMGDLTCTETVVQQKLREDGHVAATEQSQYDYLIMVQASRDNFALNESRIESGDAPHKPLPMLVTNGFSMLLLVFHPYYADSFRFTSAPEERVDGRLLLPMHFDHISGTRSPAALSLRGREYPLDLTGTAWIDPQSGEVVRMDAGLGQDMSDLGLRSLHVRVDYKPTTIRSVNGMPLPARAVIDLETPRQHWRNTHVFSNYKSFSTAAEQDTTVKVISKDPGQKDGNPPEGTTPHQEER